MQGPRGGVLDEARRVGMGDEACEVAAEAEPERALQGVGVGLLAELGQGGVDLVGAEGLADVVEVAQCDLGALGGEHALSDEQRDAGLGVVVGGGTQDPSVDQPDAQALAVAFDHQLACALLADLIEQERGRSGSDVQSSRTAPRGGGRVGADPQRSSTKVGARGRRLADTPAQPQASSRRESASSTRLRAVFARDKRDMTVPSFRSRGLSDLGVGPVGEVALLQDHAVVVGELGESSLDPLRPLVVEDGLGLLGRVAGGGPLLGEEIAASAPVAHPVQAEVPRHPVEPSPTSKPGIPEASLLHRLHEDVLGRRRRRGPRPSRCAGRVARARPGAPGRRRRGRRGGPRRRAGRRGLGRCCSWAPPGQVHGWDGGWRVCLHG